MTFQPRYTRTIRRALRGMLLLAVFALIGATSVSCGDAHAKDRVPRADDGRIIIEFWHGMGSEQGRVTGDIVRLFNESQDKYRVLAIYQGRYDALAQKLIASLYAGRNPAVAQMYPSWSVRYLRFGYLQPIDHFLEGDKDFADKISDYYPVMIAENTLKDPKTGQPVLASIPFNKSVYVLYVNQNRMTDLGWNEAPKTWEEFYRMVNDMTVIPGGATQPTTFGFASRPFIEDFTVQAFSANTQLLDEETGEILVDSPDALEALHFLRKLTGGEGENSVGYVDSKFLNDPFGSGRIATFIASTASFPFNDRAVGSRFVWTALPVPSRDGETPGKTLMQGTNVGIFGNKTEEEQQGAWEFVKFLTSPEMTAKWGIETGYMPVRKSAKELPKFKEYLERSPRYASAVSTLDRAAFEPRKMYWESVRNSISQEVEATLLGRKTPEQAMADARRAIEDIQRRSTDK